MSQALATQAPAKSGIITTPTEFRGSLAQWRDKRYHVLTPAADFTALPPQWGLLPVKVQIDLHPEGGEVYQDPLFCGEDEVCLTKIALSRISQAAGMSFKTERMDNRMILNYWEVRATVKVVGLDGTPQEWTGTEELDLRDGSERSKKVLGRKNAVGALIAARAKGMRNCEARAINAAIRLYGIKQKYSRRELESPFIVVRMLFQPNMSDPTQAAIATSMAMGGVNALYQQSAMPALPAPVDLSATDVIDAAEPATSKAAQTPAPEQPRGQMVESVTHDMETGQYAIKFASGLLAATDQSDVAQAAQQAKKAGHTVTVVTELRDGVTFVTELQLAKTTPSFGQRMAANASTADGVPIGGRKVADVKKEERKGPNGPFILATVFFAGGEQAKTTDTRIIGAAEMAKKADTWVRVTLEDSRKYQGQVDLKGLTVIDPNEPDLPLDGDMDAERY